MKPAIFLDRDGTLIKDSGFLSDPSKAFIYSFTVEALKLLQKRFDLFIVTNQCGIENGVISSEEVENVNRFIIDYLTGEGIDIKDCYVCPHAINAGCKCRKPQPFFAEQAATEYDLDLTCSYVIGDHLSDIKFAEAFGGTGIYLMTGHGGHHRAEVPDDVIVCKNLLYAAKKILEDAV